MIARVHIETTALWTICVLLSLPPGINKWIRLFSFDEGIRKYPCKFQDHDVAFKIWTKFHEVMSKIYGNSGGYLTGKFEDVVKFNTWNFP